jgi:thioredoxin reductase (NADPH)
VIPVLVAAQVNTVTHGDGHLTGLILKDRTSGATETVLATALFILIGAEPHTDWLPERIWRDGGVRGHRQ